MENNKYLILVSIVIILCIIAVASSGFHNKYDDDIYLEVQHNAVGNFSYPSYNNSISESYLYSYFFELKNVSSWYDEGEVIIYFYNESGIVSSGYGEYESNNTTITINNESYSDITNAVYCQSGISCDDYFNMTSVNILLIKDGDVVFNETKPFQMNYEDFTYLNKESNTTTNDSNTSSSDDDMYYVASADSDIYHEWYCSRASKISDANKITFQTREEAENQGYTPCKVCCP